MYLGGYHMTVNAGSITDSEKKNEFILFAKTKGVQVFYHERNGMYAECSNSKVADEIRKKVKELS